ncbi:hypothetical protein ACIHFE_34175 [Streptomyces sp. NPDC052396]|uniref:hypothetical protein n=1 Tax=Streptomyces sp. NPDC052396 TaxID=3365689 RepID=UPI0037D00682
MSQSPGGSNEPEELIEFTGDITDYWSYTQVRDWILLHAELSRTALHLYLLLRSMVSETARRMGGGLRRMSLDQLCWLLPGINGKPASPTMIKDALRVLAQWNLVTNPDGGRLVTSAGKGAIQNTYRRYQVNDLPPDAYTGWRNVWDKLDAYTPDWRENPPQPPTHTRTPNGVTRVDSRKSAHRNDQDTSHEAPGHLDGRISDQPERKSVRPSRKKVAAKPLTSENAAPKEAPQRSSSLPAAPGPSSTPTPAKRESTGRTTTKREQPPHETGAEAAVQLVLDAWAAGADRPPPPASTRRQLTEQIPDLCMDYPSPEMLRIIARFAGERTWHDLGRAALHPDCKKRLTRFNRSTSPTAPVPAQRESGGIPYCGALECDEVTRMRSTPDDQGYTVVTPCPQCHPSSRPPLSAVS